MIAALILVGCGGSSDSGSPDDALDTICKDSQAGVRQLGAELGQATRSQDQAALADVFEQLSDLLSSLAADLRGLAPPPEDAGVIDDYLDTLESSVTTTSELADAVSANQTAGGAPSAEMRQLGARRTRT